MPLLTSRFPYWVDERATGIADGDCDVLEVCGFGGSKRRGDPLNV